VRQQPSRYCRAEHDHALADLADMLEGDEASIDADMNIGPASLRPGISRLAPRGAPEPTKIASILSQQFLQAVDARAAFELKAEIEM